MTNQELASLQDEAAALEQRNQLTLMEKKLLRALDAVRRQHDWRPIATAPRDGQRFLFVSSAGIVGTGVFLNGRWFVPDSWLGTDITGPVLWKPMPEPPSSVQG